MEDYEAAALREATRGLMQLGIIKQDLTEIISKMRELPPSRDVSIAITNAETALLWLQK